MTKTRPLQRREMDEAALGSAEWPTHWPEALRRVHAARGSEGGAMAVPSLAVLPAPEGLLGLE